MNLTGINIIEGKLLTYNVVQYIILLPNVTYFIFNQFSDILAPFLFHIILKIHQVFTKSQSQPLYFSFR